MTDQRQPTLSMLDVATIIVTAVIAAAALWIASRGPTGPIPIHFDWRGVPDRMGDRTDAAMVVGTLAVLVLVTAGGMGLAVRRADEPARRRGLAMGQALSLFGIGGATLIMCLTMLRTAAGEDLPMTAGGSFLLLVLGAGMGRVGPNPFIGVRTPWTYKSRLSWERSNRLAGRLFFWLGLAGLLSAPFAPATESMIVLGILIIVIAAWAIIESWRVWRDDPERKPF